MATRDMDLLREALNDPVAARQRLAQPADMYADPGTQDPSVGLPEQAMAARAPTVAQISQAEADAIQGISTGGKLPTYSVPGASELAEAEARMGGARPLSEQIPGTAMVREPVSAADLASSVERQLGTSRHIERSPDFVDPSSRLGRAQSRAEDVQLAGVGGAPGAGMAATGPSQEQFDLARRLMKIHQQQRRGRVAPPPRPSGWSDMSRQLPGYQMGEEELGRIEELQREEARQQERQAFAAEEAVRQTREQEFEAEQQRIAADAGATAARERMIGEMRDHEEGWQGEMQAIADRAPEDDYWERRGPGAKAMTVAAMFVAGLGGGAQGAQGVWDRVRSDIDRDLQSQKELGGAKRELLAAAQRRFATEEEQAAAVREGSYKQVAAQLSKFASEVQDPVRKAKAEEIAARAWREAEEQGKQRRILNAGTRTQQMVWDKAAVEQQKRERAESAVQERTQEVETRQAEEAAEIAPLMTEEAIEGHFEKLATQQDDPQEKVQLVRAISSSPKARANMAKRVPGVQRMSEAEQFQALAQMPASQLLGMLDDKQRSDYLQTRQKTLEAQGLTRDKWIPLFGAYAATPEDAKDIKESTSATAQLVGGVDQILALAESGRKFGEEKALIRSIHSQMKTAYNKSEKLGALDGGTIQLLDGIIGDPTSILDRHGLTVLKRFRSQANANMRGYAQRMGMFSGPSPSNALRVGASAPASFRPE